MLVAGVACRLERLLGEHVHAGLALDRLEEHSGGVCVDRGGDRRGGGIDRTETWDERRERRLL